MAAPHPVVIDIGSGFTKMGLAGNIEPQIVVPTCVANSVKKGPGVYLSQSQGSGIPEADFYIGDEAYQRKDSPNYLLSYPVCKGRIENWDDMERFLQQALFRNMRCFPEEHLFLLTEPPFNTPENRELTAEIMFETFNVKGLHIAVQAVLALYAQWRGRVEEDQTSASQGLTGVVVDSGDGQTHIIPVADGYVVNSCIQEIPLGGRQVNEFVGDMLRDRGEPVPPEQRLEAAKQIKEQYAYLCRDVVEEYEKFDREPEKKFKQHTGINSKTNQPWSITVGYERFLAPEIFFNPEIFQDHITMPLPSMVDKCILNCPIDYRRRMYGNVVLSGGSTTFLHFRERLQRDMQQIVDRRLKESEAKSGVAPQPMHVHVDNNNRKATRYAAWLGGALLADEPSFESSCCKLKREYDEVGPQCMRGQPSLHC